MSWPAIVTYLFIQAATPGPNNLTCLYLGGKYGFSGTKKFLIGSASGFFLKGLLCGVLNVALASRIPWVVGYLKWAGAAYMIYLAWKMARSGWEEETSMAGQQKESSYISGIVLQVLNVKSWIANLSIFAVYVMPHTTDFGTVFSVVCVFTGLMIIASVVWALFGAVLKRLISRYRKPFGIIMGISLIYCAMNALL